MLFLLSSAEVQEQDYGLYLGKFSKQFLSLDYESENSLLQNTFKRLEYLDRVSDPILVCNERHRIYCRRANARNRCIAKSYPS